MAKRGMWEPTFEAMPEEEIATHQSDRLQEQLKHVYRHSGFYEELYDKAGLHPSDVRGLEDLTKVPTMDKDDLRAYRDRTGDFFCGALCVPESDLEFVTRSTGTSGNPNWFGLTTSDLESVADHFARMWWACGLRSGDRASVAGKIQWHGYVEGMERGAAEIGAVPIRTVRQPKGDFQIYNEQLGNADLDVGGGYNPEQEAKYIQETGFDPEEQFPNVRFCHSSTHMTKPRRDFFEDAWGVPFYNCYGSGDQFWTTYPCSENSEYYHVSEDHFIFEILDKETKEPVDPGERGILHITNLRDEANPYIRYNMEDLVVAQEGECDCGRTTMRIKPLGRESWSVDVVDSEQPITSLEVESVIWEHDDLFLDKYQLVEEKRGTQERLYVRIARENGITNDLTEKVVSELEDQFGVTAHLEVVLPENIGYESSIKLERVATEY